MDDESGEIKNGKIIMNNNNSCSSNNSTQQTKQNDWRKYLKRKRSIRGMTHFDNDNSKKIIIIDNLGNWPLLL